MVEEDGRIHLPSDFIRAAERYGLMRSIDRWVIRECLQTLRTQPPPFLDLLHLCSINLSAVSLGDEGFLDFVEEERILGHARREDLLRDHRDRGHRELRPGREAAGPPLGARGALRPGRLRQGDVLVQLSQGSSGELPQDRRQIHQGHRHRSARPGDGGVDQPGGTRDGSAHRGRRGDEQRHDGAPDDLGVDYAQGNWVSPPRPLGDSCAVASATL